MKTEIAKQKAALTREIKAMQNFINDLKSVAETYPEYELYLQYKIGYFTFIFNGKVFTSNSIARYEMQLKSMNEHRERMNAKDWN